MNDRQYIHVAAALAMQEFLLRVAFDNLVARVPDANLERLGGDLRKQLAMLNVPESATTTHDEALAIQSEALRQFDTFWKRLAASRPAG